MARPKQEEHRRGQLIKLLSEEKQIIQRNAYVAGLTISEYMRRCSLNKRLHSRIDDKAINRLSSLCGLMKHLLMPLHLKDRGQEPPGIRVYPSDQTM
jgi:hypothetical protein